MLPGGISNHLSFMVGEAEEATKLLELVGFILAMHAEGHDIPSDVHEGAATVTFYLKRRLRLYLDAEQDGTLIAKTGTPAQRVAA